MGYPNRSKSIQRWLSCIGIKGRTSFVGAEIGVWEGKNAQALLDMFPRLTLFCVDQYRVYTEKTNESGRSFSQEQWDALFASVSAKLSRFGSRFVGVRATSVEAASLVQPALDFVFIDAGHTLSCVSQDIQVWYPKVKVGGLVLGHDYHHTDVEGRRGVKLAVDGFATKTDVSVNHVKDVWGFRKKNA